VGRGEPDCLLTGAWEAVRWSGDGGEGGGSQNSDVGHAQAQRVGNGGGDECGEEGASSSPFYGGRDGVEASEWGGDRRAAMVMAINGHPVWWERENRGGEWGVKRGAAAAILGGKGMPEWRQRTREVAAEAHGRASEER
jgi:hypothetical protein